MPEHQQTQQSTESKTTSQKQATPRIQTPVSNPFFIIQRARINPKSLTPADILQLQRTIGNRAVGKLLSGLGNPSTAQQAPVQRQPEPKGELIQGKFESGLTGTLQAKEEVPPNKTGMPDHLKSGIENISGMDLSGVRVHYNSSKPKQVNALAYVQGTDIHVAPGQERHLPHEAWHVVQQAQGRVKPTMQQMKDGFPVNDEEGLEREADVMGAKALQMKNAYPVSIGVAHQEVTPLNLEVEAKGESEAQTGVIGTDQKKVRLNFLSSSESSFELVDRRLERTVAEHSPYVAAQRAQVDIIQSSAQPPVQKFKTNRYDPKREVKKSVIKAQNSALEAITSVFVDENSDAVPKQALAENTGMLSQAERAKAPILVSDEFAKSCRVTFNTEEWTYTVELVNQSDSFNWEDPTIWDGDIPTLVGLAKNRTVGPYMVLKDTKRITGAHRDRAFSGAQSFAPNPAFSGMMGFPGFHYPVSISPEILAIVTGMSQQQSSEPTSTSSLSTIPSFTDPGQPFKFLIDSSQDTSWKAPPTSGEFESSFKSAPESGRRQQQRVSLRPKTSRKSTGKRDPGRVMGIPAWKKARGGHSPIKRGKLASHEWCHLVGDGDRGPCAPDNLVVGTNSVNTEQLAIEVGLRDRRHRLKKLGYDIWIDASAYGREVDLPNGKKALVAESIRYHVYLTPSGKPQPQEDVIDHIMNAERGSITTLEFQSLERLIKLKLNTKIGVILYMEKSRGVPKDTPPWLPQFSERVYPTRVGPGILGSPKRDAQGFALPASKRNKIPDPEIVTVWVNQQRYLLNPDETESQGNCFYQSVIALGVNRGLDVAGLRAAGIERGHGREQMRTMGEWANVEDITAVAGALEISVLLVSLDLTYQVQQVTSLGRGGPQIAIAQIFGGHFVPLRQAV